MDIVEKIDMVIAEPINEKKAVAKGIFTEVGRKVQGLRGAKLTVGIKYDDGTIEDMTWKQFTKSNLPWVGDQKMQKEEFFNALVKQEKQFNRKVDFNVWAKQNMNVSWEEKVSKAMEMMSVKYAKRGIKVQ
jgi:hypothetical protein